MKKNYVGDSIDNNKFKGDKIVSKQKVKIKKAKSIKIHKRPKYIFRNKRKLWRIPDNF